MSTKYERILWIDQQIRMKRYPNAHTVMEHFELRSERVAYNDRIFMKNRLHAPIEYD
ncbi:hypothetical protein GF312_15810, partial [Candidatus Poribacteria bacterium]|nr:hypothetical protein [Candidatus Poribacteria bacterium]